MKTVNSNAGDVFFVAFEANDTKPVTFDAWRRNAQLMKLRLLKAPGLLRDPLACTIALDNMPATRALMESGVIVSVAGLHIAFNRGNARMLLLLLEQQWRSSVKAAVKAAYRSFMEKACKRGWPDVFQRLADVMDRVCFDPDVDGNSVMHWAFSSGSEEMAAVALRVLTTKGVDATTLAPAGALASVRGSRWFTAKVRAKPVHVPASALTARRVLNFCDGTAGYSPLHFLATTNLPVVLNHALDAGGDPSVRTTDGKSLVRVAKENMAASSVRVLLARNPGLLHAACKAGDAEELALLLDCGADPDALAEGDTPLHAAASEGVTALVNLLLEHGASVDALDSDGLTPLRRASKGRHLEVMRMLSAAGASVGAADADGQSALHVAACAGDAVMMRLLHEHGADVAAETNAGWTPLHCAANGGHTEVVEELLDWGADPNITTNDGFTAFHEATRGGHVHTMNKLASLGADVTSAAADGSPPLLTAFRTKRLAAVSVLLARGETRIDAADASGVTALLEAYRMGDMAMVDILLACGANANCVDNDGAGAIHYASMSGDCIVIGRLLAADPTVACKRTLKGAEPLHFAYLHKRKSAISLLLAMGGNIRAVDSSDRTALHYAAEGGDLGLVRELVAMNVLRVQARDDDRLTALDVAAGTGVVQYLKFCSARSPALPNPPPRQSTVLATIRYGIMAILRGSRA